MFTKFFQDDSAQPPAPKEGDVYKELTICGKKFLLLYGYYEDFERESRLNDPMPIYPDFIKEPVYTDEGLPFVTAMQDVCEHYSGREDGESCSDCIFFQKSEELFGFCVCPNSHRERQKTKK